MPFTDSGGSTLGTEGGTVLLSALGPQFDDLYGWVVDQVASAVAGWIAGGTIDFAGPPVDFSALAGPFRYARYRFHGLAATLQYSADAVDWHDALTVDFSRSGLQNIWNTLQPFVDALLAWLQTVTSNGYAFQVLGVTHTGGDVNVANNDVVKLVVELHQFNQPIQISHYFKAVGSGSTTTSLVTGYREQVQPALANAMDYSVTIDGYRVEDRIHTAQPAVLRRTELFPNSPVVHGAIVGAGGAGTSQATSSLLAACVSWETPFAGRGERGRSFIPGVYDTALVAGQFTDAALALYQAWADAVIATWGYNDSNVPEPGRTDATWALVMWRGHLTGAGAVEGNAVTGHDRFGRAIYTVQPVTKPPFNPLAVAHGISGAVARRQPRAQRRRGIDVRIGRRRLGAIGAAV